MQIFELTPRTSIGPFQLGLSRAKMRAAAKKAGFGLDSKYGQSDYFGAASGIEVEYDDAGRASFIGANNRPSSYRLVFEGTDLFDTTARKVFKLFAERESEPVPSFDKDGHTFPEQIVTMWGAGSQYDHINIESGRRRRVVWAQIGIGNSGYLAAVAELSD